VSGRHNARTFMGHAEIKNVIFMMKNPEPSPDPIEIIAALQ
jgi:hypothetical protein